MSGTPEGPVHPEPAETHAAEPALTERHLAHRAAELRDYRAAFRVAQLAMAVIDEDGVVVVANDSFGTLLGTEPSALREQAAADLVDLASDGRTWHAYREVLGGRRARFRCTRRLKHSDGRSLWAEVTVAPVPDSRRVLLSIADISDRRELHARLRHLQMHDPVTRLPNRALFFERLSGALEGAEQDAAASAVPMGPSHGSHESYESYGYGRTGRIGLCYLDLDGFKAVNDTLGHRVGDRLLAAVATRLTECADSDGYTRNGGHLVARLGGDEFAILVEDSTGTEQLADLARSVLDALQLPFDLGGQRVSVSASIGVVERAGRETTATALMQAADTTLYWAKADGKARWTLFDPERNAHRMTRQSLSSTLRPAVERGEFALEYQPLVDLTDGAVRGVEALVRWNHPQFGSLAPNRFIGIAEEDGSIVELGRWVLNTACRQARQWQKDHPRERPIFVSVNVAVRQVWDSDLVADVAGILAETGLAPHLLQLELTESAVMGSNGRPLQALQALSDMGVRIAIDDFGTGYSNLAYLSRLPVSVLKLDGSFVRGFQDEEHANPADELIVEALVHLAHRLGLTVTAECVETAGQASRLRRIGCDTGQGWLYSRAVAPDRIAELIGTEPLPV
ncbi:putative bifunctional diguanylate cyclase/phosphodiesterase [Streptomyces sp. NPDC056549]|uniref:putative bifunctional diguanylate cyclase/phosphodiesterase n=1 Tax=Streptomyces sp. NPDC056549 TaxID=3345864 RepID=UPI003685BBEB